jgi:hypothetical protein
MNNRLLFGVAIVFILSATSILSQAKAQPSGQPFQDILAQINKLNDAITNLQQQINNNQGISGYEIITKQTVVTLNPGNEFGVTARCSSVTKKLLGGGASAQDGGIIVRSTSPDDTQTWDAVFKNVETTTITTTIRATAICANVQ